MKYNNKTSNGFTLLEIIFAIAIIGILTTIAISSYSEHIKRSHLNNTTKKAMHLEMLLKDYWEDNKTYLAGDDTKLRTELGWHSGDKNITARVETGATGNIDSSFLITVTHKKFADEPVIIKYARN